MKEYCEIAQDSKADATEAVKAANEHRQLRDTGLFNYSGF